jgi:spore maturation protein CgeB
MRIVMFYHSLVSDWNHGNAHFLRGMVRELTRRGHDVIVHEPAGGWSYVNLMQERGSSALAAFSDAYPELRSQIYDPAEVDPAALLDGADLVIVHEWNDPALVRRIGEVRARTRDFKLLFHDTHHRAVSARDELAAYDLKNYDGVLAFGRVLRDTYLEAGWTERAWTWHEAADTTMFHPIVGEPIEGDLIWVGNWGDGERSAELSELLLGPIAQLGISASIFGVRYPEEARAAIARTGARYRGWLANFEVPRQFSRHRLTVHVPRRFYAATLPGIPTIRMFEALACGIPLISAPWQDREELFRPGRDYTVARTGDEMTQAIQTLLADRARAKELAEHGRATILQRHTCVHRADELLKIYDELEVS